jgi:hypothetical protein
LSAGIFDLRSMQAHSDGNAGARRTNPFGQGLVKARTKCHQMTRSDTAI